MTVTKPNAHLVDERAIAVAHEVALALNWGRVSHGSEPGKNTADKDKLKKIFGALLNVPAADQDCLLDRISTALGVSPDTQEKTASKFLEQLGSQSSPHPMAA